MGPARQILTATLLAIASAALASAARADPAVWRVTGGHGGEIHLLGSMHVLRDADYPLPASIDALYASADTLVMELDLNDLDPAAEQSTLLTAALLPRGRALQQLVPPPLYALTDRQADKLGVDMSALERFEPWMVAITLLDVGMRRLGFQAERGVDRYLADKARLDGKPVIGLETLDFQVGVFDRLSDSQQEALLAQTVRELDTAGAEMDALERAWRDGRLDGEAERLLGDFDGFPALYETLIKERNARWAPTLEHLLGDGKRYLVVVGALHLVGKDSVIELLKQRGLEVVRVD